MDVDGERVDAPAAAPASTPSVRRPLLATWLLAASMATAAVLVAAPGWLADPDAAVPDLRWVALLPLFALAEVVVIHLPTQRNAHGHTLREIPAVLGLTFLAPQQYVTAYVVGAVLALVVAARMRGVKLAFNAAMFSLEAALGTLAYHLVLQSSDVLSYQGWLAVFVAVLVTDLLSAAAVTAAISLTEGAFDGEVLHEALTSGSVAGFINTCVALLVATLVIVQPTALPLLAVVVVLLFLAYRVYISLARGHAQTQLLYRFVERTSAARSLAEVAEVTVIEAAELMHAERAYLVEVVDGRLVRCRAREADGSQTESMQEAGPGVWWWSALESGVTRFERPRADRHDHPGTPAPASLVSAPRDGLAAPLRGAGATKYVLVVCDRSFEKETFSHEDVQVFEALAAHAGVAVERSRSVTELEALAEELVDARDAALAASDAKSLFLANMSHEIRTPLTTVLATAEMLEDSPLDDFQAALLEKMQRQGGLLHSLVESILDFSRIESGEVSLASAPFDLHTRVAEVAGAAAARATGTGPTFVCDLDPDVPRLVLGDAERLGQVLSHLLDNAFKFTHEGQVRLVVRPDRVEDVVIGVAFDVADTGIGIAAEHQDAIFEVFSQVDPSATRHYEGTGLGLAICRQLVGLMGGSVGVESRPGAGSTFTVRLPLAAPPTRVAPGREATAEGDRVPA